MSASQAELLRLQSNENLKYLYLPEPIEKLDEIDSDKIPKVISGFARGFIKVLWHTNTPSILDATQTRTSQDDPKNRITSFRVISSEKGKSRGNFHGNKYLYTMTAKFPLPSVKVIDKHKGSIRICVSNDAGLHAFSKSRFKVGDITYCEITDSWVDDWYQWCRTIYTGSQPSYIDRDALNECILNLPQFTTWTDEIVGSTATFLLPHCYSYSPGSSFPLYLVDDSIKVTQELVHPENIVEHLYRAQISLDGTTWENIEIKEVMECLEIDKTEGPSLMADIYDVSPDEVEENIIMGTDDPIEIPIHQVVTIIPPNSTLGGISTPIPLNITDPIVALFAKAHNVEALKYNNRSNCTNMLDEDDPKAISSISTLTLTYGRMTKFIYKPEDMRSNRMLNMFPTIPYRKGRFGHGFCRRPFDPAKLSGFLADSELKAILNIQTAGKPINKQNEENLPLDCDIITHLLVKKKTRTLEQDSEENINKYIPHVNLLIHRDLVFTRGDDGIFNISIR